MPLIFGKGVATESQGMFMEKLSNRVADNSRVVGTSSQARLVLLAGLLLVWPIPHSIALRNLLLGLLFLGATLAADWTRLRWFVSKPMRVPNLFCAAFTAWILLVAVFISPNPWWSLGEIKGQWIMALLTMLTGLAISLPRNHANTSKVMIVVIAMFALEVLAVDGQGIWLAIQRGTWPHWARLGGLTAGPGKANYETNFFLSALVAEVTLRMEGRRTFNVPSWALGILLAFAALSVDFEAMRNELFDLGVFLGFVAWIGYKISKGRVSREGKAALIFGFLLVVGLGVLDLAADPRWKTLWATVPIALNTSGHLYWLNQTRFPIPRLPSGQAVSQSNYLRIAWMKEGLEAIVRDPWGVGYGRSAFAHAIRAMFGAISRVNGPNDSLLDIAVGSGVIGVTLWLGWLFSLGRMMAARINGAMDSGVFAARFLLLIVLSFGVRMAVDSDMQNYTLEQFCFMVGLLAPLAVSESGARVPCPQLVEGD
jgi:hypothetical protein